MAVVTGGGRGIGRAIALAFAREGLEVAVISRSLDQITNVQTEIEALGRRAIAIACDVSDKTAVTTTVARVREKLGPITVLVNNAGIHLAKRFAAVTDAEWQHMLAVNLTGIFYFTQVVLPDMEEAGWGRIINISSAAGRMGIPYAVPYNATKHGVVGFTRGLALDLARTGITVNAICPGWVRTDMTRVNAEGLAAKKGITYEQALEIITATSPQKRLIDPEEVAHLAVMLLSDLARSITGQELGVDGGIVVA
ncbi:MAG: SDR family oxidoreductase [candidate division KSB1 bacterium]|nr:SDR family oxidoreductase [candidate division KSB1 bacterium]MDZ7304571.1 SDR family oxidoreductase [candidate division KSB1 bacterium]